MILDKEFSRNLLISFILLSAPTLLLCADIAPQRLDNVFLSVETEGWRQGARSYLYLRADGSYQGLWRESYSFTHVHGYTAIPGGSFVYVRDADGARATLQLFADGDSKPITTRLKFNDPSGGVVQKDDPSAAPEKFRIQSMDKDTSLRNMSLRCKVDAGGEVQVGFVTPRSKMFLVRLVGPTLKRYLDLPVVENPELRLHQDGVELQKNDVLAGSAVPAQILSTVAQLVGAFPLDESSGDVAMLLRAGPGAYVVEAKNPTDHEGEVLIEVYTLPF